MTPFQLSSLVGSLALVSQASLQKSSLLHPSHNCQHLGPQIPGLWAGLKMPWPRTQKPMPIQESFKENQVRKCVSSRFFYARLEGHLTGASRNRRNTRAKGRETKLSGSLVGNLVGIPSQRAFRRLKGKGAPRECIQTLWVETSVTCVRCDMREIESKEAFDPSLFCQSSFNPAWHPPLGREDS